MAMPMIIELYIDLMNTHTHTHTHTHTSPTRMEKREMNTMQVYKQNKY